MSSRAPPGAEGPANAPLPPGEPLPRTGPRGGRTLLVVTLLAGIYFGYSPALDGELQFDDLRSISGNAAVKHLGQFFAGGIGDVVGTGRALTGLTFALNYRAGALSVRPYHLVNLGLHLATVLAVLALTLQILRRLRWPSPFPTALLVAALFGLHPLQSQAVAYICQRAEVLASLFYLLALLLLFLAGQRRWAWAALAARLGAFGCVLLGFAAKPILASFPAALLLCFWAFPADRAGTAPKTRPWAVFLGSLPFWALTVFASSRLLAGVSGTGHAGFDLPTITPGRYLLTQSRVVLTYLRLLAWPSGQNVDWDFAPSASLLEPRTAFAVLAIGALACAALLLWRWSSSPAHDAGLRAVARLAAFGLLWFFILLSPTSSVVPVADMVEEHRVYLASFGVFLPAAAAAVLARRRLAPGPRGLVAGAVAATLVCAALTAALVRRAAVWETGISLWSDAVAKSPGKARPHMNLGYALTPTAPERAVPEYRRALELADRTILREQLLQDLAGALLTLRRYDEAIGILRELMARSPEGPELSTNIAIAYLESGRLADADAIASRVTARWPLYPPAWHTLGQLALARRDSRAAVLHFERELSLDPDATDSLISLAAAQEMSGDRVQACRTWARYAASAAPKAAEKAQAMQSSLGCPP